MGNAFSLPLDQTRTQEVVSRYVIYNAGGNPLSVFVSFRHGCNIRHFTLSSLAMPLNKVYLRINGSAVVELYDRGTAGTDCILAMQWTPTPPILETYTVEVLIDWIGAGNNFKLAGKYEEGVNLVAIATP